MRPASNALATRTHTFATAAALADVDAFVMAVSTSTSAETYATSGLDGTLANPGPVTADAMGLPRFPSVTSSASASTYNTTDAIQFVGTRGGQTKIVTITLTQAGGGETIVADEPLDTLTSIIVPAQDGGGGQFEFGVSGIACRMDDHGVKQQMAFKALGAGTVKCGYAGGFTDNIPVASQGKEWVSPERIYADTTDVGVTVYE